MLKQVYQVTELYKSKLLEIISNTHPKQVSSTVKKHKDLYSYICTLHGDSISEKIYVALHGEQHICKYGNKKTFISFKDGYRNCGRAAKCKCTKESVSVNVKQTQSQMTDIQKEEAVTKRRSTNLSKYGHINAAQQHHVKEKHKEFYSNKDNISLAVAKVKQTKLEKYGDENYRNNEQIKRTTLEKYGVSNVIQDTVIKNKAASVRKENYDPFKVLKQNRSMIPTCQRKQETQVYDYLKSIYNENILHNDRLILKGGELDIVLPDKKLAIEYCGLYYHSELSHNKKWNYHKSKMDKANENGYRLITLFSDEWLLKNNLVKNKLKNILSLETNKIWARQCAVAEVKYPDALEFHNTYHIQESPKHLGINIGLYFNNELVMVSSFLNKGSHIELVRLSSNIAIVGGASKIFKHFIKSYDFTEIISFSDNRWGTGKLYETLGFVKAGVVPPMQYYVENYEKRYHKRSLSKNRLGITNNLTEWETLQQLNYDRIWDCGKIKWAFKLNTFKL